MESRKKIKVCKLRNKKHLYNWMYTHNGGVIYTTSIYMYKYIRSLYFKVLTNLRKSMYITNCYAKAPNQYMTLLIPDIVK